MVLMRESVIEMALTKQVKQMGGKALKFISPGNTGMPDRLVLLPKGKVGFVEVKAPGKAPRPLQLARHEMLKNLGFQVHVLDDCEQIEEILNAIQSA
jgi:hypothetical protein